MWPRPVIFAEEVAFSIASPSKFKIVPHEELCDPHSFLLGKNAVTAILQRPMSGQLFFLGTDGESSLV